MRQRIDKEILKGLYISLRQNYIINDLFVLLLTVCMCARVCLYIHIIGTHISVTVKFHSYQSLRHFYDVTRLKKVLLLGYILIQCFYVTFELYGGCPMYTRIVTKFCLI